jgi:hypothetical protein
MTNDTTQAAATDTTTENTPETTISTPSLTSEQEINALRAAHQFFSNFDRVPGFLANQWSQALDTIAVVANSLIGKNTPASDSTDASAADATDTSVTQ